MKSRGFTLIELLGVIIILALIIILAFPNIINSIKKTNDKIDESTLELIYNAADIYISNHSNDFKKESGNKVEISLDDLQAENLLPSSIKLSNEDITNTKCLQATYTDKFNYELKNIGECENYIHKICYMAEDQDISLSKQIGTKYICHLDEDRIFYVLEDGDNTSLTKGTTGTTGVGEISLIMDRNYTDDYVPLKMAWCDPNGKYPRSVDCNHDNLDPYIEYIQNIFKNKIVVSLPTAEQIAALDGYTLSPGQELFDLSYSWLYDYLIRSPHPVPSLYGYWTISKVYTYRNRVWHVDFTGKLDGVHGVFSDAYGIRPVITISKSRLD